MTKIYSLKFDNQLSSSSLELLYPYLSQNTLTRVKRFSFFHDALRCALGELLAKYAISHVHNVPTDRICFLQDSYGKPYLEGREDIHFNISHSGQRIVCATSQQAVGIDLEEIVTIDALTIAQQFFLKDELDSLTNLPSHDRADSFYTLWTMKESYIKLVGNGLNTPLDSFKIIMNELPFSVKCPSSERSLAFIKTYTIDPRFKLSVCSKENSFDPSITELDYNPNAFNISSVCSPNLGGVSNSLSAIFSK